MTLVLGTALLWAIALGLAYRLHGVGRLAEALRRFRGLLAFTALRLAVALLGAGFVAELLPRAAIEARFGAEAGLGGVLLAMALGPLTPGGGFVSFAVGAAALQAGAAPAPVLAYVTAWALFSLTKLFAYELPLLGRRPVALRLAVSWPVPLVVGALALAMF